MIGAMSSKGMSNVSRSTSATRSIGLSESAISSGTTRSVCGLRSIIVTILDFGCMGMSVSGPDDVTLCLLRIRVGFDTTVSPCRNGGAGATLSSFCTAKEPECTVPKTIHLMWAAADESWAHQLRARLAQLAKSAEVERIQLNIADDAVADAMLRLTTFDVPVRAVVSVWSDVDTSDIRTELAPLCDRIVGYEVAETVALAPPRVAAGDRADALANIALLRRPPDIDHAEWLRRWQGDHTPIAIAVQGTFGYVQNEVRAALTPDSPRVDGIVEELFPMAALRDPHAFYGSGGDGAELNRRLRAMTDSIGRFGADRDIDVIPTSRYVF